MKKIIYMGTLLALMLTGCYEDKGSYDYKGIEELKIEFPNFKSMVNIGDKIIVEPKFSQDIPEDAPYLSYRWSINNRSREGWNQRKLEWMTDTVMVSSNLVLEVTDNRTGLIFTGSGSLIINSIFDAEGWIVLSEVNGKSSLSFVKQKEVDDNTNYVTEVEVFRDAYNAQENEVMGENPIDFQEHFSGGRGAVGQFVIFQDTPMEVDGLSFTKVLNLSEIFTGGVLPAKIVGGSFMGVLDILQDDKGQLYTRLKSTNKLFHSNYFLPKPIKYENEVLTDCKVIRGRYTSTMATLIHDQKKQRFLYIFDGGIVGNDLLKFAGVIKPMPAAPQFGAVPKKFFPLDNTSTYDVVNVTYGKSGSWYARYQMIVREKSSGNYFYQSFKVDLEDGGTFFTIGDMKVYEIGGLDFNPDAVCLQTHDNTENYVFIAQGDQLYMWDPSYPNTPMQSYYDFGKDYDAPVRIASMNGDTSDNERMGLGLSNGDFCIMRVAGAKNFKTDQQKMEIRLEPKDYLGNIIKVYNKIGNLGRWN